MTLEIDTKIQKWGNGLGLRVSGLLRDIPHFEQDTPVRVDISEDGFTVRKTRPNYASLPFSEEELLADLSPSKAHSDLV